MAGEEEHELAAVSRRLLIRAGATVGAGAVLLDVGRAQAASSPGVLSPTAVQTAAYTASPGDFVPVDASGGSVTVTLPAGPGDQTQVGVTLVAVAGPNLATVACAGSDVVNRAGGPRSVTLTSVNQTVVLQYQAATKIWYTLTENLFVIRAGGSPTTAPLDIHNYGNAVSINMATDWAASTTGNTTYDSVDIFHRSAGDGVYVVHAGGVSQATLLTGSVASNNGITYVQNPNLSGASANAVKLAYVATGVGSALSVSVSANAVTVKLATDRSGSPASSAAQVVGAVNGSQAAALVSAYNTTDSSGTSNGSGTVTPMSATALSGGFTGGPPGANAALNPYVPFWLDDVGTGTGTIVAYRQGRSCLTVTNSSVYDPAGIGVKISHAAGGPAINIYNQAATVYGAPQVAGNSIALNVVDYSKAASINIVRYTGPSPCNPWATFTWQDAVISVTSIPSPPFPLMIAARTSDSQGVYIRNDGTASFGTAGSPSFGRFWIDQSDPGGPALNLILSNPSSSTGSGASMAFVANGVQHAQLHSSYDTAAQTGTLTISLRSGGHTAAALTLTPAAVSIAGNLQLAATGSGTAVQIVNQGSGAALDVQVGPKPSSAFQILANGQVKFASPGNEATGSGTAALGSNCPAAAASAPYVWEKITTSDGSQGYVPVWK